jgi:glycerol uptake facilitator-like aquaporin
LSGKIVIPSPPSALEPKLSAEVRLKSHREAIAMSLSKRATAEFFGTFWLVFGGCGAAVLDAAFPGLGIGFVGVALAFGLTVLTMAFAIGHISGCHLNPAVTLGLVAGKRFPASEVIPYWIAQVLGAIAAAGVLFVMPRGKWASRWPAALRPTVMPTTRRAGIR